MLEDPENNPQPGREFDHPAIQSLDLFTHADPMPDRRPEPVQQEPTPIEPLLPPETDAPAPKPLDPPLRSSVPATERREAPLLPIDPYDPRTYPTSKVPPLAPMPPDPFDQKTGGVNFDLLGQFRKMQEEVAILTKQLRDVWPPRSTNGDDVAASMGTTLIVNLSSTSGSAGNKTTPVSFVYTVSSLGGTTLATGKSPLWPSRSENGKKVAASKGLAYYDANNVLQLAIAFEASGTGGC